MKFRGAILVLFFGCGSAAAFHPLIGEDTAFLGKDVRQLEAGLDYAVSREGQDVYATATAAELSYGLFDRFDVLVTVPWQGWSSHGLSESGLGDVLVEVKFPAGAGAGWDLALKPGFSLPAGDEAKSLGAGEGGAWVYGIAGRASGPWQFYLNAGYLYNRNSLDEEKNILKGSAAAVYGFLPKWLVTAELAAETNPEKDSVSHPVSSVFGLVWSPLPSLDLDAGVRFGLTKPADDMGLMGGITLRL
ncbi:MAG: hypothetical protein A2049_04305 [Elusimicrobia bacterium GWA2_62_23]|nr:MAG: hypothetical protein A2049_04305 [Elusimicrobia bacterium GWA2_62_23]OGR69351.1 MAG: hypothetical protein A2179_07470 [Elusimicrobia bacterium GWC2_63_65]